MDVRTGPCLKPESSQKPFGFFSARNKNRISETKKNVERKYKQNHGLTVTALFRTSNKVFEHQLEHQKCQKPTPGAAASVKRPLFSLVTVKPSITIYWKENEILKLHNQFLFDFVVDSLLALLNFWLWRGNTQLF